MNRKRNQQNRKSKKVILISYEGNNKTEKNYFNSFITRDKDYVIKTVPGNETDPVNLVKQTIFAIEANGLDLKSDDMAFCVFDTDGDDSKNEQIALAMSLANKHNIKLILSNPCIELWFLLHFEYTSALLTNNQVISKLKKHCAKYEKNYNIYNDIIDKINIAISNAKRLEKFQLENNKKIQTVNSNPSTEIYKIIEVLI